MNRVSLAPAGRRFARYPTYHDSRTEWLGHVPAHWNVLALKRIVDPARPVTYGIVQCGPDYPGGVLYIRPVDMTDEAGVKIETLQRTAPEIAAAYGRSTVRPGDVVVSIGPSFGKVLLVPPELDGANLTQGTARIASARVVRPRFLFWVLRSQASRQAWTSHCSGATFSALTLEILKTCAVALPPIEEQHRIADFLDRETAKIDALVAKKERLIELLDEERAALIDRVVTKGLNPSVPMKDSGTQWLGEIPAHWGVCALSRLVDARRRITYGIVQPGQADPTGPYMVRGQDYSAAWAQPETIFRVSSGIEQPYARARLAAGDLVLTIVGAGVGNVAIVPDWLAGANITQTTARIAIARERGVGRFYALFFQSHAARALVDIAVRGAAQPGLTLASVSGFRVVLPSIEEQLAIADFLERETSRIGAVAQKIHEGIDRLREYRTALISAAVTGKIDVREDAA